MYALRVRRCAWMAVATVVALTGCELGSSLTESASLATTAGFNETGSASVGRAGHVGLLLGSGQVLVAGGISGPTRLASAELFDRASGTWSLAPNMSFPRHGHAGVTLNDGRALVVGGVSANTCADPPTGNSAELFDPATGVWSATGSMSVGRSAPAAVVLSDGRVLVAGGGNRCGAIYTSAEIYDPATGLWSPAGAMQVGRQAAAAVRLADGRVLVAGGFGAYPFGSLASAELYDPATGTWSLTGSMAQPRLWTTDEVAASDLLVLLPDGRAFTAGGGNRPDVFSSAIVLRTAEAYDPATGTWSAVAPMVAVRWKHRLAVASGRVLVVGGLNGGIQAGAEAFDPATGSWVPAGSLVTPRYDYSVTRLTDGRVLVAQGQGPTGVLASAEIFAANTAPVARVDAVAGDEGAELVLSAAASSDADGDPLTFVWTFGDGSPEANGVSVRHTYADDGVYVVTVTVSDGSLTSSASATATVANVAPVVSYESSAGFLLPGEVYTGAGSFADPGVDSWAVVANYGDESGDQPLPLSGQAFTLSHVYSAAGLFSGHVTVTDDDGGAGSVAFSVEVRSPQQVLAGMIATVDSLAALGVLSRRDANSLTLKLEAAVQQLDRGNTKVAEHKLESFITQVNTMARAGEIPPADAEALLGLAARVLQSVRQSAASALVGGGR